MNYQKEMEAILARECVQGQGGPKRLLLHACCAPCSSYVLEYLQAFFAVTVFYYNPNITEEAEYRLRAAEEKRLIDAYNEKQARGGYKGYPISFVEGPYEPERFFAAVKGMEQAPEGGERCFACYRLRLEATAREALQGYDYFTTTLTISPLKNAEKLNDCGQEMAAKYGVAFLPSDFKKKGGYARSIELSREYGLYRQDYCGCIYSRLQREAEKEKKAKTVQTGPETSAEHV